MRSLNKAMIIGRIGQDPELSYTSNGKAYLNVSVATDESYNDQSGNKVEKTEWHKLIFWDKSAETFAKYANKGDKVYIEGKIQTNSYDKDGVKMYSTQIVVSNFLFLGGKDANAETKTEAPRAEAPKTPPKTKTKTQEPAPASEDDDLPF